MLDGILGGEQTWFNIKKLVELNLKKKFSIVSKKIRQRMTNFHVNILKKFLKIFWKYPSYFDCLIPKHMLPLILKISFIHRIPQQYTIPPYLHSKFLPYTHSNPQLVYILHKFV